MRILLLLLFCGAVHAQQVNDLSLRRELNLPTNVFKTVLVTGYGESPALARQDAFRIAVEQVAGIVIATELQSSNQRLVRDQTATYSQARISNFAIVTMDKVNGIYQCLVWVTVRSACTSDTYNCVN